MTAYVLILLAAAAVTYILTPLVRRFAVAVGAMHAARERDVHELPTPLLGGFAIYGGMAAALLLASRVPGLSTVFTETAMAKGLLLAGGLVVIMGFVDDRWGMGALSKLAGQVAAGVILVWSGAEIPWLPGPGGVTLILTNDQQIAVTILVVVVTMNAVNFIDGLDGLAAGIVGIGALAFFAYCFTLTHRLGLLDQTGPALVSVVLAGVCIGFLPHNFYPARIFMGDTGSMLIGLMLAYAPISSLALLDPASLTDTAAYAAGTVNRYAGFLPLLVPAAIMLIPYADLLLAVVRRTRAGMSVFAPDKKHLQHRLLAIGHSHRTSVLIMYLWAALFAGSVAWLSIVRTPLLVLASITVAAMLALLLVTMPRLRPWTRAAPTARGPRAAPTARGPRAAPAGARERGRPALAGAMRPQSAQAGAREPRRPAQAGASRPQPAQAGAPRPQSAEAGATRPQPAQAGAPRLQSAEAGATRPQSAEAGATRPQSAEAGATRPQSAGAGATRPQPAQAGVRRRSPAPGGGAPQAAPPARIAGNGAGHPVTPAGGPPLGGAVLRDQAADDDAPHGPGPAAAEDSGAVPALPAPAAPPSPGRPARGAPPWR